MQGAILHLCALYSLMPMSNVYPPLKYMREGVVLPDSQKALLLDIDGTLSATKPNVVVSKRNIAAMREAIDAGKRVCLATGRIPGPWTDDVRKSLGGAPYTLAGGVYSNGGLVLAADGSVVAISSLPLETVRAVVETTRGGVCPAGGGRIAVLATVHNATDGSISYIELSPDGGAPSTWCTEMITLAGEPIRTVEAFEEVLAPLLTPEGPQQQQQQPPPILSVLKFVIFTASMATAMYDCAPSESEAARWAPTVTPTREALEGSGVGVLDCGSAQCEVLPAGVHKGDGAEKLISHLGVAPETVLACGDAENDVEMLRLVGLGVAMGNAKQAAVEACDVQLSSSNAEDGVAEAIERFALGRGSARLNGGDRAVFRVQ